MPIWTCPKCEKNEVYEGTVIQQKSSGAVGFIGEQAGESSISPIIHRPLGSKSVEVTVTKCKHCDIILGEKDKVYTHAELTAAQERKDQHIAKNKPILLILATVPYVLFPFFVLTEGRQNTEIVFGVILLIFYIILSIGCWKAFKGDTKPSIIAKIGSISHFLIFFYVLFFWGYSDWLELFGFIVAPSLGFWILGKYYQRTGR